MFACNQRDGNVLEYRPIMRVSFHTVSFVVPVYCGNHNGGGGRRMAVLSSKTPTTYGVMNYGTKRHTYKLLARQARDTVCGYAPCTSVNQAEGTAGTPP